jgi:hypothetical protein
MKIYPARPVSIAAKTSCYPAIVHQNCPHTRKTHTHMKVQLTPDQRKIIALCGQDPDAVAAKMKPSDMDGDDSGFDNDGSDDSDEAQDGIQRAKNHLEACDDEDEDVNARVTSAIECLQDYLTANGGMPTRTQAASLQHVAFPNSRASR